MRRDPILTGIVSEFPAEALEKSLSIEALLVETVLVFLSLDLLV